MSKIEITEIEKYRYGKDGFLDMFGGKLRNQDKFELHQQVWIEYDGKMIKTEVIGVELPLGDNVAYLYKVRLPREVCIDRTSHSVKERLHKTLNCQHMFGSKEDAKANAIKNLERKHALNMESIERFFKEE